MLEVRFEDSFLDDQEQYPRNIPITDIQPHAIDALKEQLNLHAPRLFCTEARANVLFHEIYRLDEGFSSIQLTSRNGLRDRLSMPVRHSRPDPRCRYVFIHAPHSRSSLYITKAMFLDLLTYHRVMPVFLEYIFPFGIQGSRRDLYGGSFRSDSRMAGDEPAYSVRTLGRSGRQLEFCYSLQSAERSGDEHRPWSVRMCAVWHTLDLQNERQAWLVVKGNTLIQDILLSRSASLDVDVDEHEGHLNRALRLSLGSHLELVRWSLQNWQWYLGTLEEALEIQTGRALSTRVIKSTSMMSSFSPALSPASTACEERAAQPLGKRFNTSQLTLRKSSRKKDPKLIKLQELGQAVEDDIVPEQPEFSFDDLQRLQSLEEKANSIAMITSSNSQVLRQLRQEYSSLLDTDSCTVDNIETFTKSIRRFEAKLCGFEAELAVLQGRVQTFSRLIKERKDLLYGILQYNNMAANSFVAKMSQNSGLNMEKLTRQMHEIAQRTQIETVSMRTITVVTLIFLPGTFISTLMSTPIVTFADGAGLLSDRNISLGALQFYCAVSVPLMAFTFIAWYIVYWLEKGKVPGVSGDV